LTNAWQEFSSAAVDTGIPRRRAWGHSFKDGRILACARAGPLQWRRGTGAGGIGDIGEAKRHIGRIQIGRRKDDRDDRLIKREGPAGGRAATGTVDPEDDRLHGVVLAQKAQVADQVIPADGPVKGLAFTENPLRVQDRHLVSRAKQVQFRNGRLGESEVIQKIKLAKGFQFGIVGSLRGQVIDQFIDGQVDTH